MDPRSEAARAKVNLALHVVGRRADGYHLIDTLVVFPPVIDRVAIRAGAGISLIVSGPTSRELERVAPQDNLVYRAALSLAAIAGVDVANGPGIEITLDKHLPTEAGIGGGSADAAAAIRLFAELWHLDLADPRIIDLARRLGADVPMCLASVPLRARGIGEVVSPLPALPPAGLLLVNPRLRVSTAAVFARLGTWANPPIDEDCDFGSVAGLITTLAGMRNDLQPAALRLEPGIGGVLDALEALPGARVVRMSGSGATCFALFDDPAAAEDAGLRLAAAQPAWWIAASPLG